MKITLDPESHVDLVAALGLAVGDSVYVEYLRDKSISGNDAFLLATTEDLNTADPEEGVYLSPDGNSWKCVRGVTHVSGQNIGLYNLSLSSATFSVYKE